MKRNIKEEVFAKICRFIDAHNIVCAEDVCQCDSINENCVDFVAELVGLVLECREID